MEANHDRFVKIIVLVVGVIVILVALLHAWNKLKDTPSDEEVPAGTIQAEASDGLWVSESELETNPDITLSLKEAVLGQALQEKKLIVFTQSMSDIIKVTDKGVLPFNLSTKYQYIKYSGTATYTVDLSGIDEEHLLVDEEAKTLIISIPHTEKTLDINEEETQADETVKKGIFSIGDLKQSEDERLEVIDKVKKNMDEKLEAEKVGDLAERMAKLSVWEIYQPVVTSVSPEFSVEVRFV